ncbi:MAG: HepT-like ribonuclease domain-containing protein [Flavobacterium sp.]
MFLLHILESIEKLEEITTTTSKEDFLNSWIIQDAILKNFIVIGEAVSNIDEEIKQHFSHINWRGAKSMRNFIVHEYFSVDLSFVWETIQETIPKFKNDILHIIKDFN